MVTALRWRKEVYSEGRWGTAEGRPVGVPTSCSTRRADRGMGSLAVTDQLSADRASRRIVGKLEQELKDAILMVTRDRKAAERAMVLRPLDKESRL